MFCERYLVNKVVPGSRVTIVGIQYVDKRSNNSNTNNINTERNSYIKVLQFTTESKRTGRTVFTFTNDDEIKFSTLSKDKRIYDKISRSIAPAIFGRDDIKKAIACLLFGGCRKRLNEGVNLRGGMNILLLGEPSTAKSQFLKFVERVTPIAVYTSDKGSSAVGLIASIVKDASSDHQVSFN
jgi:DNA replication licensing factor MCM5